MQFNIRTCIKVTLNLRGATFAEFSFFSTKSISQKMKIKSFFKQMQGGRWEWVMRKLLFRLYSAAQIYPNQNIRVVRVSPIRVYADAYTQIPVYSVCAYASLVCMS